jgi:hypothetical protein
MNTSDPARRFTFASLSIPEDELHPARMELYHSSGPGYAIFPGFLSPDQVAHMRRLWSTVDPTTTHALFPGKKFIYAGCPNYYLLEADGSRTFYNCLWNAPTDEVTHAACLQAHTLRNRLSGRLHCAETMPFAGKSLVYRVILSKNYKLWVAPHRDYMDHQRRFEKNRYDFSRLQATLFLSTKGVDYGGVGFKFRRNDGQEIVFGDDVDVAPGDLVIWRYNNEHSVTDIRTSEGQFGFMRILHPPENIEPPPVPPSRRERALARLKRVPQRVLSVISS